jgi:hypothetical protein
VAAATDGFGCVVVEVCDDEALPEPVDVEGGEG